MRFPWSKKPKPVEKNWVDTDQGLMNTSWDAGWWQQNLQPKSGGINETVEACVSCLSQTVAMCPAYHLSDEPNGAAERQVGSYVERVLKNPNPYTTRTQFFNDLIRAVYFHGNGYAVAERDGNGSIKTLTLVDPRSCNPVVDPDTGEIYYWVSPTIGGKFDAESDKVYPSRNVLHVKINTSETQPHKGVSPIKAATNSIAANSSIVGHQSRFFSNMSRPSGVMSTDEKLTKEQMLQIREAIAAQSKGMDSGKVPVLGNGLKWQPMSLTSQDAQLVEAFGMTVASVSRVFRVPLPLINDMQHSTLNNAESAMRWFLASGLGFLLEHIELELGKLFGLPFKERVNLDTKALLRSDWKSQIETLGEGVLKGIYSPNEARNMVGLPDAKDGDEPRVQQQVVPLSAWDKEPAPEPTAEPEEEITASLVKGFNSHGK